MCLSEVYTQEDIERIIEEMPEIAPGVVVLKKGVEIEDNHYINYHNDCTYRCTYSKGFNQANPNYPIRADSGQKYWPYYHFFYQNVPDWLASYPHQKQITCLVKKEWITAIGTGTLEMILVIVTEQAFFPTHPATEAKLEDFLAWQEQEQKETVKV